MEVVKIKKRNFMFREKIDDWYLNTFMIMGEKRVYVVDTGLGSLSMIPVMEKISYEGKPILIINTHYHWDHIWGNGCFENSSIMAHRLCRDMIEDNWDEMTARKKSYFRGEVVKVLPNIVFEDEVYFPEDGIRIMHTPGHTADSISILDEKEGIMNFADNIGDTPEEIYPSLYTDASTFNDSIDRCFKHRFDICVSGHNEILCRQTVEKVLYETRISG